MKIQTINAKVWWLAQADEIRPTRGLPAIDAVKSVTELFQFAQSPTQLPAQGEGFSFREGKIVIDGVATAIKEVSLYNDGIVAEVYSTTDDAIAVIQKLLELGASNGMRPAITPPTWLYQSFIFFDMETDLNALVAGYDTLSQSINEKIGDRRFHHVRAVEFATDPKVSIPQTVFRIERKLDVEFSMGKYFSLANTTTENHLRLLDDVKSDLVGKRKPGVAP